MSDKQTIEVYDARVEEYTRVFARTQPDAHLQGFIDELPPNSHVLDLGCGPGNSAAMIQAAGHSVDAVDASHEMVRLAQKYVPARYGRFEDIQETDAYDGIWANFSLLHAAREDMPSHLNALATAIRAGGVLHLGMKLGSGSHRDRLGRFYTYYQAQELKTLLATAGFVTHFEDHGEAEGMAGPSEPFIILRAKTRA
ncbi:MAG: class I SAM-dependent methyltransferase [Pseudomonadota bacterium]